MSVPIVAIVGKPNVGKSSLFNRIVGEKQAVVSAVAGTTRDRIMRQVIRDRMDFLLVDTGGIQTDSEDVLENDVRQQAYTAISSAEVILFVLDSRDKMTAEDLAIAEILRKKQSPKTKIYLVLSKCDGCSSDIIHEWPEVYSLGFGDPFCISPIHNWGISALLQEIEDNLIERNFIKQPKSEELKIPQVAVFGKPNVGKSSFINALLSEEKLIVSDLAGTTRDATDTIVRWEKKEYNFIDTAGVRRPGKIEKGIEKFSVLRTWSALARAEVCLLLINADEPISKQDQHLAGDIADQKKGLILVINKWDLREKGQEEQLKYINYLRRKFAFVPWAPVVFVSAKTQKNVVKVFPLIEKIAIERNKRIQTATLNAFQKEITHRHLPSGTKIIKPKLYYVTQTGINPPEFVFFVNNEGSFHFSYRRYIENQIRQEFGFAGTGVRIVFREKERTNSKRKKRLNLD